MKKISQYILVSLTGLFLIISGCQKEYEMGELKAPTNVNLTFEIVGADDSNPYGDGSGLVNFTATADSEITYRFDFGDDTDNKMVPSGKYQHRFAQSGINTYNITVFAIGTGGMSSTKTTQAEVLSLFEDEEANQLLTGGSSKSWYWAADQLGHLGLGPNDQAYESGGHTWPEWYQAAPWEKIESTLYDCELVFFLEEGKLKFEQLNPYGEAFIQGIYSEELGLGEEGSYPWDITGVKNVFFSPSSSIATEDGGYRKTTMNFTDDGFMGFYAGSSQYEIIEITENQLRVRMVQGNEPLFAWYHIFTTVKPEQK